MYHVGRFLQLVGLGLTGIACVIAFDQDVTERAFWTFALLGLFVFVVGHFLIPKR